MIDRKCQHCGFFEKVYELAIAWTCSKCGQPNSVDDSSDLWDQSSEEFQRRIAAGAAAEQARINSYGRKPYKRFGKSSR